MSRPARPADAPQGVEAELKSSSERKIDSQSESKRIPIVDAENLELLSLHSRVDLKILIFENLYDYLISIQPKRGTLKRAQH